MAANAMQRRVGWAGTFARGGYVAMCRCICPIKSALSCKGSGPHLMHGSLDQYESAPPNGISIG